MATRRTPFIGGSGGPTSLSSAHSSGAGATSSSHAAGVASFTDPLHTSHGTLDVQLRYIRFLQPSSHSLHHLHQFYCAVLKMSVERQIELGPDRSRTVFAYPGDKVGLRFEYERYGSKAQQMRQARGAAATTQADEVLPSAPTTSVSLLLYVDSVPAFVARAREHGFVVWLDAVTLSDPEDPTPPIRTAVLLDPLGIKVRLMESEATLYPRAARAQGRLGYVSLAVADYAALERCIKFYDAVFRPGQSVAAPIAQPKRSSNNILAAHQEDSAAARRSVDPSLSAAAAAKANQQHGFRLVDMERFIEEMRTYYWLANGPRRKHTAVCLSHQVQRRGTAKASGAGGKGGERSMEKTTGNWAPPVAATATAQQPLSADAAAEAAGALPATSAAADGAAGDSDEDDDDDDESMQSALALLDRKLSALAAEDAPLFLGLSLACNDMEHAVAHLANTEVGRNAAAAAAAASVVAAAVAAANAGVSPTAADLSPSAAAAPTSGPPPGARLEVQHIPGFPRFIAFLDPAGIPLEISDGVQGAGRGALAASSASAAAYSASASMHSMMGIAGGVGSATAAAMLMRSNMMRAQAGTAAMAAASAAAAAAAAAAKSTAAAAAHRSRAPLPLPPLSFTPSPASTRAGSPTGAADEWSDGEGGGAQRSGTAGRRSRVRITASAGGGGDDSDGSVSDDADDAPAAGLGSYVDAALHYSGSGGGSKPSRSRRNSGNATGSGGSGIGRQSTAHRRVATASSAAAVSPNRAARMSHTASRSRSPSRPHSSHPNKPMSPSPHAPTTPRSGRSRPNSSKVR